jgi:DNA modification methylase
MARTRAAEPQQSLDLSSRGRGPTDAYEPFVPGPNPNVPEFMRSHATPYDLANDRYNVDAFDRDLIVDKAAAPKAIYDMHSYWSKKHWAAIREYIRHYLPVKHYPRGTGLVLDCFSGSGMTGVAAMMEERPCVLIDVSPAAAFISHCYTHPVDPQELQKCYERMLADPYPAELKTKLKKATGEEIENLQTELDWLYATKCDRCGGDATTEYVVYSQRFQCPNCAEIVPLFDCPNENVRYPVGGKKSGKTELKKKTVCPYCVARNDNKPNRDFVISTRSQPFGSTPVMVHYRCEAGCKPAANDRRHDEDKRSRKAKFFAEYDLGKLERIGRAAIPHWYPDRKMMDVEDKSAPWGVKWRAGTSNFRTVSELYTKRNLWALSAVIGAIARVSSPDHLRLAVVGMALGVSRMNRYVPGHWSVQNRILAGTYYLPQLATEVNIGPQLKNKFDVILAANAVLGEHCVGRSVTDNSTIIRGEMPVNSFDYVFTDPAYVDKIQYGELNFVWESWLGFDGGWLKDEIVVNPFRNKSHEDWDQDMRKALANLYQALKPGRWLSLCYHDTDPGTWTRVQDMLLDTGFEIHTVTVLDPKQKSLNQMMGEKVAKGDLVVNCRKPRPGDTGRAERDESGIVSQRVRHILIEVLGQTGGQSRERLWDLVLKRLLARGQLAEHRFDDVLGEVGFKSESGRWFLKEEFESLSDNDVKNEEQAGAGLTVFARLRMAGVPAAMASEIVLHAPQLTGKNFDEDAVEKYIRQNLLKGRPDAAKFKLSGRMKGVEFTTACSSTSLVGSRDVPLVRRRGGTSRSSSTSISCGSKTVTSGSIACLTRPRLRRCERRARPDSDAVFGNTSLSFVVRESFRTNGNLTPKHCVFG